MLKSKILTFQRETSKHNAVLSTCQATMAELTANNLDYLHSQEKEIYQKFRLEKQKLNFLRGRMAAKAAIAKLTNSNLEFPSIKITNGIFEQPITNQLNVKTSISHCDNLAVAVAYYEEHLVAIDIEPILGEKKIKAVQSVLTEHDTSLAKQFDNSALIYTTLWTAKEALSKVINCGLMIRTKLLEINQLQQINNHYQGSYSNFFQYGFTSFKHDKNTILSIVYPKKSHFEHN